MGLKQIRKSRGIGQGRSALALITLVLAAVGTFFVQARAPQTEVLANAPAASVATAHLPKQGLDVMALIRQGGPFQYEKDGTVFGNRERLLPSEKRGYYREYTVPTPGLRHRGARRIVCGGQKPKQPDACFYTEDHYASFKLIAQ